MAPPQPSFGGHAQKRKFPSASPGVKSEPSVKVEQTDAKRFKPAVHSGLAASHGDFRDVRTAAAAMVTYLKVELPHGSQTLQLTIQAEQTKGWGDAFLYAQMKYPEYNPEDVLGYLKKQPKIKFNELNDVFSYEASLRCWREL
jgi:hypothetical protein